jgi:hypothetical protein
METKNAKTKTQLKPMMKTLGTHITIQLGMKIRPKSDVRLESSSNQTQKHTQHLPSNTLNICQVKNTPSRTLNFGKKSQTGNMPLQKRDE